MIKKIQKHLGYYFSILLIFILGLFLTELFAPNLKLQIAVVAMTIFFYVFWGILHHKINHELTLKIVVEYVLIGSLGLSILFFIIEGALL